MAGEVQDPGRRSQPVGLRDQAAALSWGRDQEAKIRAGTWTDPTAGEITVSEWIDRWMAMQDVGLSTMENREYLIRRFIRPSWGARQLSSLTGEEITMWENGIPPRRGVPPHGAGCAQPAAHDPGRRRGGKPPLIPYNPAIRPRNRGRRTGRRLDRSPQRVWATPLEVLLVAERAALLTGRDEEFTMLVTIAYTGMRWGETIGLERDLLLPTQIHVEWQLREISGHFHRLPPKDDSYRSPNWEPLLPVDIPPSSPSCWPPRQASTPGSGAPAPREHGGSGRYVFLGPDGGHYRRSNYARRVFRPACDGRYQPAPASPAGWSSWTPRRGRATRSPHGRRRCPESRSLPHGAGALRA